MLTFGVDGESRRGNSIHFRDLMAASAAAVDGAIYFNVFEQVQALSCAGCADGYEGSVVTVDHETIDTAGAYLEDPGTACRHTEDGWSCSGTVNFNVESGVVPTAKAGCSACVDCESAKPAKLNKLPSLEPDPSSDPLSFPDGQE